MKLRLLRCGGASVQVDTAEQVIGLIGSADLLFTYILQHSAVFEDVLEQAVLQAHADPAHVGVPDVSLTDVAAALAERWRFAQGPGLAEDLRAWLKSPEALACVRAYVRDLGRIIMQDASAPMDADVDNAAQLAATDDAVGDRLSTGAQFTVDEPVRDYPFIVLDGAWLNWDNELGLNAHHLILESLKDQARSTSVNARSLTDVEGLDPTAPAVFADKVGDLCFIEAVENIAIEDAVKLLKPRFRKVYWFDQAGSTVRRLAGRWRS